MSVDLRREIKQEVPFSSLEQEAFLNLLRTAALLEHRLAERLKAYGLTPTQYNALRILRGAGPDGLCRNEVRSRMVAPVPDATRLLDRLTSLGLTVRDRDGEDHRFVTTRITDGGLELLNRLDGPVAEMLKGQLGHMPRSDLRRLVELLGAAREGS